MSEFKRKVGDPLRLRLKIEPKDDSLFVRVELTDQNDNPVAGSPVALANQGGGIYADDNSTLMPNTPEVRANYFVYYDAGFTEEACEHGGYDTFERDDLDLSSFFPKGARVLATVKGTSKVKQTVKDDSVICTSVRPASEVAARVCSNQLGITVKTNNKVQGVVNE